MSTKRKIVRFIDRAIDKGLSVLLLIVLGIGIYFIYDAYFTFNSAAMESTEQYLSTEEIQQRYKEAIAWITIDDTGIDYPVAQGKTNEEYLNKDANGEYALSGAIFLDNRNDPAFMDPYSLLYGHHMAGGYMFGALDEFEKTPFFLAHRTGQLRVLSGEKKYRVDVFAMVETDASEGLVFEFAGSNDSLHAFIKDKAMQYRTPREGKRILALSTCKSPLSTERLVLFCTIQKWTAADDARRKFKEEHPLLWKLQERRAGLQDKLKVNKEKEEKTKEDTEDQ